MFALVQVQYPSVVADLATKPTYNCVLDCDKSRDKLLSRALQTAREAVVDAAEYEDFTTTEGEDGRIFRIDFYREVTEDADGQLATPAISWLIEEVRWPN